MDTLQPEPDSPDTVPDRGLATRLAGWSADHRRKAIGIWLALLAVALLVGGGGAKELTTAGLANGDSAKGERALERGDFVPPAAEQVLIQVRGEGSVSGPAGRNAAAAVVAAVRATGEVQDVRSPFAAGNSGQISADGRSALVLFAMTGKADSAEKRVEPVIEAVERVAA